VLFLHANAPVADGFVKSFAHPGGNMTGFIAWPVSNGKQVELFKELIPDLGSLVNPNDPVGRRWLQEMRQAGNAQKLRLTEGDATNQAEIERATSRFELVLNLQSAQKLGLTIPQSILFRANKVIK
jgi:putative ABC transport system substrate-binding protein